mmetsp:Transcript_2346/g.2670  ORF Transcript_2346/g.2670 Transcript_2346/m.2670 type:complete len:347 (-) Transcript_2346:79-1119(-)
MKDVWKVAGGITAVALQGVKRKRAKPFLPLPGLLSKLDPESVFNALGEPKNNSVAKLYDNHVPLQPLEKLLFTGKACALAVRDPHLRGDMVAAVAETTGEEHLKRLRDIMLSDETGHRILKEKPVLNLKHVDMDKLLSLEKDTVGGAFALTMQVHGLSLGSRTPVQYVDDAELAYVMQRYREIHDILHIILGFPFSVSGELAMKWFELVQTRLPMTALAAFSGAFARSEKDPIEFFHGKRSADRVSRHNHADYVEWAIDAGNRSNNFMNVYLEECWNMKMDDFREAHSIPKCPEHLVSLDMVWNGNPIPLIQHYEAAIGALEDKPDREKRAAVFQNAIDYLKQEIA